MSERLHSPLTIAAVLLFPAAALAFQMIPISRQFESSGSGATQTYELVNTSEDYAAIEMRTMKREIGESGVETLTDAEDDFLIFPAQIILEPGSRQSVRVSYIGDPSPPHELSFRLVAEQLPIEGLGRAPKAPEGERGGQVVLLMKYQGSLYVRPPNARPKVRVGSASGVRGESGAFQLELKLANTGTARAAFEDLEIRVTSGKQSSEWISLKSLKAAAIMAKSQRSLTLPWPSRLPWTEAPTVEARSRR